MRRLTPRRRQLGAGRLPEERGAAAVMVALLMVPLLGFAAIAVDVAAVYSDRAQLRNGADAAALAVALDCAHGTCGNQVATATSMLLANTASADAADATVNTPSVARVGNKVTVTATADQAHWFAPVLGLDSTRITATSTATWASASTGWAELPIAISWCEYQAQLADHPLTNTTSHRITAQTKDHGLCDGPSGKTVPGYAVTVPDTASGCRTTSAVGGTLVEYAGTSNGGLPAGCSGEHLAGLIGTDLLIPVWDAATGKKDAQQFRVYGYAAFHLTGYDVYSSNPALYGFFTWSVQQSAAPTPPTSTAPDLGVRSVYLQG